MTKHYSKNPRQITKKQDAALLASLDELGDLGGIVHDLESDQIIGGNQRSRLFAVIGKTADELKAAGQLVIVRELPAPDRQGTVAEGYLVWKDARYAYRAVRWTPEQCEAANLRANMLGGAWDWDALAGFDASVLLASGFEQETLRDWKRDVTGLAALIESTKPEPVDAEPQISLAEQLQEKWQVRSGDIWQLDSGKGVVHRLECGDCTDAATVARLMGGEKADCAFTSPPYSVGVDYGETYKDTIENLRSILPKLSRVLLEFILSGGFAVINFSDVASGRDIANSDEPCEYPMAFEYWPIFRKYGWLLWSRRIWCKPNARVNSKWCISSNRAASDWEHLWTWRKPGETIIKRVDGELRSASGWYQSIQMHGVDIGKSEHGAGMATGIAEWMINVHSRKNYIALEPFCGTGTTIIACENLSRHCRAIEISPAYCAVTLQRFQDATGATPTLLERLP
jgi:DNA modification methylase